jgi:hypothetical protein
MACKRLSKKEKIEHLARCMALESKSPPADKTIGEMKADIDIMVKTAKERWYRQGFEDGYSEGAGHRP